VRQANGFNAEHARATFAGASAIHYRTLAASAAAVLSG